MLDLNFVVIRDEVAVADSITIRWSMVTPAGVKMKVWPAESTNNYDALNPDTRIVGFDVKVPPNSKKDLTVLLIPQKAENKISKIIPLS